MDDRGTLTTETRHPASARLDELSTTQLFDLINGEDATVAQAVARAKPSICKAVDIITKCLSRGGRLIYVGAGTSGRLGTLDSVECPPTFQTDPKMVQCIIAGGNAALTRSIEGAEDDPEAGIAAVDEMAIGVNDVLFGIATGGTTPFVHGALERAKAGGAQTVFLACVPADQVDDVSDVSIRVISGPEILTGSTRMKAGTATKMVLNLITTAVMTQLGKTYGNLMVDLNTKANRKLTDRGCRILQQTCQLNREDALSLLSSATGQVKVAIVMHKVNVTPLQAESLLEASDGRIRDAIARGRSASIELGFES